MKLLGRSDDLTSNNLVLNRCNCVMKTNPSLSVVVFSLPLVHSMDVLVSTYFNHLHRSSNRSRQMTFPNHFVLVLLRLAALSARENAFISAILPGVVLIGMAKDKWPAHSVNKKDTIVLTKPRMCKSDIRPHEKHFIWSPIRYPILCTIRLSGVSQSVHKRSKSSG